MEVFILVVLLLSEIALYVYSAKNRAEKGQWAKNKLYVHGGQFVFFLLTLLLPNVNLNIRFKLIFVILIIRTVIAGIIYLVYQKKQGRENQGRENQSRENQDQDKENQARENQDHKYPVARFFNLLANVVVISLAVLPAFIFAEYNGLANSGSHEVTSTNFIMIDENREDPFEGAGSRREVPVYAFYPADGGEADEYPLVLFSHGAFGYYASNMSSYTELASRGYVVLSIEHSHHSIYTKNSKGKIVTVDQQFINDVMTINDVVTAEEEIFAKSSEWVNLRVEDETFVLDEIEGAKENNQIPANWYTDTTEADQLLSVLEMADTERVGLYGHSLGGATSVTVGRDRDEVGAVIDLDGTMLGEEIGITDGVYEYKEEAYPKPLLNVTSESHFKQCTEAGPLYVNSYICENAVNAATIWFKGTAHMNFTDLPLFSPVLASNLGTGAVDPKACVVQLNKVIADYFDYYLKGEGELTLKECYE